MKMFSKKIAPGFVLLLLVVLLPAAEAGKMERVEVCHNGNVITVGFAAQAAHWAHGDPENFRETDGGACEEGYLPD